MFVTTNPDRLVRWPLLLLTAAMILTLVIGAMR